jgi:hypothetical protein
LVGFVACTPQNPYSFSGANMSEFFPFDGDSRTWQFINEDETLSFKMNAEVLFEEATGQPGSRVYPVVYYSDCPSNDPACVDGEEFFRIHWQSTDSDGVSIHGYSVEGGEVIELKPPIQLSDKDGKRGDIIETKTGGTTWTSELVSFEACPVRMNVNWEECAHFRLDGDGTYPLQGDWWAIVQYNVVAMQLDGAEGMWQLSTVECGPPESCDGQW